MLKKLIIPVLLLLTMGIASAGKMINLEEAAEFESLSVHVSKKGHGKFRIKQCDNCEEVKLKVSPATKLEIGGKHLPVSALSGKTLRSGTVFFQVESGLVTRIKATR